MKTETVLKGYIVIAPFRAVSGFIYFSLQNVGFSTCIQFPVVRVALSFLYRFRAVALGLPHYEFSHILPDPALHGHHSPPHSVRIFFKKNGYGQIAVI